MNLLRSFLIVFFCLSFFIAFRCEAKSNGPIYDRLIVLQPKIDRQLAKSISDEIYTCHKKIGIDKFLLTAIYNQESELSNKAKNCLKGVIEEKALDEIVSVIESNTKFKKYTLDVANLKKDLNNLPLTVCLDLGIGQINVNTALKQEHCSDLKRLVTDFRYNISCSCKVLDSFKKGYSKSEEDWWTRYNSSNPDKRDLYKKLVMRFYPNTNSDLVTPIKENKDSNTEDTVADNKEVSNEENVTQSP